MTIDTTEEIPTEDETLTPEDIQVLEIMSTADKEIAVQNDLILKTRPNDAPIPKPQFPGAPVYPPVMHRSDQTRVSKQAIVQTKLAAIKKIQSVTARMPPERQGRIFTVVDNWINPQKQTGSAKTNFQETYKKNAPSITLDSRPANTPALEVPNNKPLPESKQVETKEQATLPSSNVNVYEKYQTALEYQDNAIDISHGDSQPTSAMDIEPERD